MKPYFSFRTMASVTVPKDVPILNPGNHGYVVFPKGLFRYNYSSHFKREKNILGYLGEAQSTLMTLESREISLAGSRGTRQQVENQRDSKKEKGLSCLSWLRDAGPESRDQSWTPAASHREMRPQPYKHREQGSANHMERAWKQIFPEPHAGTQLAHAWISVHETRSRETSEPTWLPDPQICEMVHGVRPRPACADLREGKSHLQIA